MLAEILFISYFLIRLIRFHLQDSRSGSGGHQAKDKHILLIGVLFSPSFARLGLTSPDLHTVAPQLGLTSSDLHPVVTRLGPTSLDLHPVASKKGAFNATYALKVPSKLCVL